MKVLVIGRGDWPQEVVGGARHKLDFVAKAMSKDDPSTLAVLDGYAFALMHVNNAETTEALKLWKNRSQLEKVVGFSGGTRADFGELGIPGIHEIGDPRKLRWSAVPEDFKGDAKELVDLLVGTAPLLHALAILCQGYLVAHAEKPGLAEVLKKIGWNPESTLSLGPEQAELTETPAWWVTCLQLAGKDGRSWKRFEEKIERECRHSPKCGALRSTTLFAALRNAVEVEGPDEKKESVPRATADARALAHPEEVAKAYLLIADLIGQ